MRDIQLLPRSSFSEAPSLRLELSAAPDDCDQLSNSDNCPSIVTIVNEPMIVSKNETDDANVSAT